VIKLYEPSPTPGPCLYVAPAENMAGRVPLIPCFLAGNSTPRIPHKFIKRKDSGFPFGCADTAAADGRRGSNVYEVNPWLWQFGHGKTRLGGLTVKETTERKKAARRYDLRSCNHIRHRRSNVIRNIARAMYVRCCLRHCRSSLRCCLNSDLSNFDPSISCYVYGMCIHADSSI
jgi:hypothetical protein